MPIPDFQSVMLPLLQHSADGAEHTLPETEDFLAQYFKLSESDRSELLSSGRQSRFGNRVGWAKQHLMKAGLLESPRRSVFRISEKGKAVLGKQPERISMAFLKQFPEYIEFIRPSNNSDIKEAVEELETIEKSPKEVLDDAYSRLHKALQQELLEKVRQSHWRFFEHLVVELLVKMGYGGSVKDAGRVTQPTNDGGIDGVIKEDKLGLDVIYLQAKRFEADNKVGRPEIQSFVGALEEKRAMKGVFITTSSFAATAHEYVKNISKKIILIDGEKLADFMIEYGVGVSTVDVYEIKRLDSDYFDSEV
jgi:restriction system protein